MGAYYLVVCPAKRQYLHAHIFGDGLKLTEQGASGSGTMFGLAILLADGNGRGGGDLRSESPLIGSWAGHGVVVASDYADEGKFITLEDLALYRAEQAKDPEHMAWLAKKGIAASDVVPNLYNLASQCYEDISDKVILALCDDPWERKALIERGAEAAKAWKPAPTGDAFSLE
jgi:hypothetical protein